MKINDNNFRKRSPFLFIEPEVTFGHFGKMAALFGHGNPLTTQVGQLIGLYFNIISLR